MLAAPATAGAVDICVKREGCTPAHTHTTLAAGLADAATGAPSRDRVLLGAGEFPGTINQMIGSEVELVGAGRDQTVLTGQASGASQVLGSNVARVTIRDLAVRIPGATDVGLYLTGTESTIERVDVTSAEAGETNAVGLQLLSDGGVVRDSSALLPVAAQTIGAIMGSATAGGAASRGERLRLRGGTGFYTTDNSLLRTSEVTGTRAIWFVAGAARLQSVLARTVTGGPVPSAGVYAVQGAGENTLDASHVTLLNEGVDAAQAVRAIYAGACDTGAGSMTVRLRNSATIDYQVRLFRQGCAEDVPASCDVPATRSANVVFDRSHFTNPAIGASGGGCFRETFSTFGTPGVVSTVDPRPQAGSPLVDTGAPGPLVGDESEVDAAGKPRLVDGDGSGSLQRDRGAFEYQRRPPVVETSATPGAAPLGTLMRFNAVASDPDGEAVSLSWTFDDAATAQGATVEKVFANTGTHSATVTATDPAGLTAARAQAVEVTAPPAEPLPDTTAPVFGLPKGPLAVDARGRVGIRLTCSEATTGSLTAATARRLRISRRAKLRVLELGRTAFGCPAAGARTVRITLSKPALRYLKRVRRLPVVLRVTGRDNEGNSAQPVRRTVSFRAPAVKR